MKTIFILVNIIVAFISARELFVICFSDKQDKNNRAFLILILVLAFLIIESIFLVIYTSVK